MEHIKIDKKNLFSEVFFAIKEQYSKVTKAPRFVKTGFFVFYIYLLFYIYYIIHCKIKRNNHQVPEIVRVPENKKNPKKIRIKIYK